MKKIFSIGICVAVTAVAIMTFAFAHPSATDTMADSVDKGFSASSDSTWGDLYRFFEPEKFEALPTEIQMIYDNTLLEDMNTDSTFNRVQFDDTLLEDMNTISRLLQAVEFDDDMTIVSTMGYLYAENAESTGVEEDSKPNRKPLIGMEGLPNLTMSLSSSADEKNEKTISPWGSCDEDNDWIQVYQKILLERLSDYQEKLFVIQDGHGKKGLHPLMPTVRNR
ncbi:MAG: hypothetical protein EOM28_13095 [Clostridia bacterium]|nr:hypothetical protein [Clostridia bacterium]